MKNVLVTGGAGYIGSHTCKLLASAGYQPICYDNLSTGHASAVKWGPLIKADLRDTQKIKEAIMKFTPLAVIHFAASAYVRESIENPLKYYQNNVGGTISLLEAMHDHNMDKMIFSSTCATYGSIDHGAISEECPQHPINPYGQSKLMIENILKDLSAINQLKHISLRYFNAAGDDKDGEIGEWHDPETHLIPLAIKSALDNTELKVFGTDFNTSDGTAVRDYVHVEDLARAHVLALENLLAGGESNFINLGTNKGHSVREIITALKGLGLSVKSVDAPRRDGEPAYLVADATKAKIILGWQAEHSDLQEILQSAINWHKILGKSSL